MIPKPPTALQSQSPETLPETQSLHPEHLTLTTPPPPEKQNKSAKPKTKNPEQTVKKARALEDVVSVLEHRSHHQAADRLTDVGV